MRYVLVGLIVLVGCGSDCDRAQHIIQSKGQHCRVDLGSGNDTGQSDCTQSQGDFAMCVAHCVHSAPCAAIDGTDFNASIDLLQCESQCGNGQ